MIEFRDALTDLLEEFGTDDGGFKGFSILCSPFFESLAQIKTTYVMVLYLCLWFHWLFVFLEMIGELPEGRHLRVGNKFFYFDFGQNNRVNMRILEVSCFQIFPNFSVIRLNKFK